MAKKQHRSNANNRAQTDKDEVTLADQLNGDLLAKLKATKKELEQREAVEKEQARVQAEKARKQREKNMSFEELLDTYGFGDTSSKK